MKKIIFFLAMVSLTICKAQLATAPLQSAGNRTNVAIYANDTISNLVVTKTFSFQSLNSGTLNVAYDALNGCSGTCQTYSIDIGYYNMELFQGWLTTDGTMNTIVSAILDSSYTMAKDGDPSSLNLAGCKRLIGSLTSGGTAYGWIYGPPRVYPLHPYNGTFYPLETGIPIASRIIYFYPYIATPFTPEANKKYYFTLKFRRRK